MSKLSEQRESNASIPQRKSPSWIWILIVLGVLGAAWAGYDYVSYRQALNRKMALDTFAQCLSSKGVRMYGAWWCPHCAEQKELFGESFHNVSYTECGVENQPHSLNEQCKRAGIKGFPTWQFPDGHREEAVIAVEDLSAKTGCKLP